MDVMSVNEAAADLKVSPSRVRAQIASGDLPAHRFGGKWLLLRADVGALNSARPKHRSGGRLLAPRMAWGLIALAEGEEPKYLSSPERSRLRARLRSRPELSDLANLAKRRCSVHRLRAHPGVLDQILHDSRAVAGGISAKGHDLIQPQMVEIYVPRMEFEQFVSDFSARPAEQPNENLIIRVPNVDIHPIGDRLGRLAVAFDLWDSGDARSRRAAEVLYEQIIKAERYEVAK